MPCSLVQVVMPFIIVLCSYLVGVANDIRISNTVLSGQDTVTNTISVRFDIQWENSWRTSSGPGNWDAAWVFVKYRLKGSSTWKHAYLAGEGHAPGNAAALELGLKSPASPFDANSNPALGVFIYRNTVGDGVFSAAGVRLQWDYGANGLSDNAGAVEIKVFGVEMVLVPDGNFYLGSGGMEANRFHSGADSSSAFLVTGEQEISIGTTSGQLYYTAQNDFAGDRQGPVPATFPKGFKGFYAMKYEISQQQYADFLNTLNEQQLAVRLNQQDFNITTGYVFELQRTDTGFVAQRPNSACHYISIYDALSYSDWAGLRPMSELEFEKAARGSLAPVPNEYAWGDTTLAQEIYTLSNFGKENEQIASSYQTQRGNAAYSNTAITTTPELARPPYRVGVFAGNPQNTGRRSAGSSYWGVMELSGGVYEVCVTAGSPAGRQYTGQHGDGFLDSLGNHNVSDWAGDAFIKYCLRGGTWTFISEAMRTSDRYFGATLFTPPSFKRSNRGYRGVRTARGDYLNASPGVLNFEAGGGGLNIAVRSNVSWTVSENLSWLSTSIATGTGNRMLSLTAQANTSSTSRSGTVTLSGPGVSGLVLAINQAGIAAITCGAYIAPGVWKEFMCHNLGAANPSADPFTPSWEINGGYWQWGRKEMAAAGPSGPGSGQANADSIPTWNRNIAPDGSWGDAVKTADDPCPEGYRVPTRAQWEGVINNNTASDMGAVWISSNTNYSTGKKFGDKLLLPTAGNRLSINGRLENLGFYGNYWSSSKGSSYDAWLLYFGRGYVGTGYSLSRPDGLSLRCISASPAPGAVLPGVRTDTVQVIGARSAVIGGTVLSDGGAVVTARGIVWDTIPGVTVSLGKKTSNGGGLGLFADTLTGLTPGTRYYARAYATNSAGTAYGAEVSLVTESKDSCGAYIAPGVWKEFMCHNLGAANPSADPFTPSWEINGGYWKWGRKELAAAGPSGPGSGQANADTVVGWNTAYSSDWRDGVKTTNDPCPDGYRIPTWAQWEGVRNNNKVNTIGSTWIEGTTNYSSGKKFGDRLFLPTAGRRVFTNNYRGRLFYRGEFGYYLSSSLKSGGQGQRIPWFLYFDHGNVYTYYGYGADGLSLRCISDTPAPGAMLPSVTTDTIGSITSTSAVGGGTVTADGGAAVTERGLVWSTSPNPDTLGSRAWSGGGTGSFRIGFSPLQPGTTYYVRAYAINSVGVAYGSERTFRTATITCGAYISPSEWKEFMCHNLGAANPSADPFTPSWEINGGYWQWGRKAIAAPGPSGPGSVEVNTGEVTGWNSILAPNGSWIDEAKTADDPCPDGYRIPTRLQWEGVITYNIASDVGTPWIDSPTNYSTGKKFGDKLFLPAAGYRDYVDGRLYERGTIGDYWSSTRDVWDHTAYDLNIRDRYPWVLLTYGDYRTYGLSVRCISE